MQKAPRLGLIVWVLNKTKLYPIGSWRLGFQPSRTLSGVDAQQVLYCFWRDFENVV
jgi:hypothetical protein